ncbi:MAG: hypothetical protein JOZ10_12010 [Acidobacteria bacterium]|nr:hypothetical protein [Acidobacteriota bacterium]MBV9147270.1 hypothetical protein [Acidobacteriota bacterium]
MATHPEPHVSGKRIHLPAPTAWPMFLAFGLMLLFASLVTNAGVAIVGAVLVVVSCAGWFGQVLPYERHEDVILRLEQVPVVTTRARVARIEMSAVHRARLPLETYSLFSGVKGGIAGGLAMILPALLYGLIAHHSIWYPINLLGGAGIPNFRVAAQDLSSFNLTALVVATIIHSLASILVGLLYAALLPMLPRRPILFGGLVAPLVWTALLYSILGVINPFFAQRIQWGWFLISQIAFGVVAGAVVARAPRVRTAQYLSFAQRAGLESPGISQHSERKDRK